jgi:hypothetical protein
MGIRQIADGSVRLLDDKLSHWRSIRAWRGAAKNVDFTFRKLRIPPGDGCDRIMSARSAEDGHGATAAAAGNFGAVKAAGCAGFADQVYEQVGTCGTQTAG